MFAGDLDRLIGVMMPSLNESTRRLFAGAISDYLGRGGVTRVHKITGLARTTINQGRKELESITPAPKARSNSGATGRIRKDGGGRKTITEKQPQLKDALLKLLDGNVIGNPENPLCWTSKSLRRLQRELQSQGFTVSHATVGTLLTELGFSLQQNRKYTESGEPGPDRDEQFRFINELAQSFLSHSNPVISVDTKKKELIGKYKNAGAEYCPVGQPVRVFDHDFGTLRASPYGIYDVGANQGFVSVGISADTAEFAVGSIQSWWVRMGRERYPDARSLLITADGGGSNGRRNRLWKKCLQDFANESGLTIHVSHFPPGTSKWNKIEHRLFSFISMNWRGKPLETLQTIVSLIAATKTKEGLTVTCVTDETNYEKGIKVSDDVMASLNWKPKDWHGEWNYTIAPQSNDID